MDYVHDNIIILYKKLLPSAIGSLLTATVASLIDTIILSYYLGPEMLTTVSLCMPIYMLLNALGMMIASGGATLWAQHIGAGNRDEAQRDYGISLALMLITGLILTVSGLIFTEPIVKMLGATDEIIKPVLEYAHVLFFFMIPINLYVLFLFFVRMDGDPKRTLLATIFCAVSNLILDILFVGPLKMGPAGAALATCLAYSAGMLLNSTHLLSSKNTLKPCFNPDAIISRVINILLTGLPLSISQFGMALTTQFFNYRIIRLAGGNAVTVYAVITQLSMSAMALYEGVGQSAQPMFAASFGAKLHDRVKKVFAAGIRIELILMTLCMIIYMSGAHVIAGFFSITEGPLLELCVSSIRIYSVSLPFFGINIFIMYYFQSRSQEGPATAISLLSGTILMILSFIVLTALFGSSGIWWSYLSAQGLTLIASLILIFTVKEV